MCTPPYAKNRGILLLALAKNRGIFLLVLRIQVYFYLCQGYRYTFTYAKDTGILLLMPRIQVYSVSSSRTAMSGTAQKSMTDRSCFVDHPLNFNASRTLYRDI